MKKQPPGIQETGVFLSIGLVAASIFYALSQHTGSAQPEVVGTASTDTAQSAPSGVTISAPAQVKTPAVVTKPATIPTKPTHPVTPTPAPQPPVATPPSTPPPPAKPSGVYTGTAEDAYYGTVQVQATLQNGQLVDVKFLQYPSERSTSRSINARAMPILASEALTAQSAQVDTVSGATFTSQAFIQSLGSALAQAQV